MNFNEIAPYALLVLVFLVVRKSKMRGVGTISSIFNPSEPERPAHSRLRQIQGIGHILSMCFLTAMVLGALGVLFLLFYLVRNGTIYGLLQYGLLGDLGVILWVLTCTGGAWCCHRLSKEYSRGNLFTPEAVRHLRNIGYLCALAGLERSGLDQLWEAQHLQLQFLTIDSILPWCSGVLIIFIAWIMDEGRKIQEEQALTV